MSFGYNGERDAVAPDGPLGSLKKALGGNSTLPGRWGLVQRLFEIWSGDISFQHPIFHVFRVGRNVFNSAAAIRDYRLSKIPEVQRNDPFAVYLTERGLSCPSSLRIACELIVSYLTLAKLPFREYKMRETPGEKSDRFLREFDLDGIPIMFSVTQTSSTYRGVYEWHDGPYVRPIDVPLIVTALGQLIWKTHRGQDLQMTAIAGHYDKGGEYELTPIGAPDEYVSGDGTWENLPVLSERIKRLNARGICHNILFYGPPGVGKSTLARNLARHIGDGRTLRLDPEVLIQCSNNLLLQVINILKPRVLLLDDVDRHYETAVQILHFVEKEMRGAQQAADSGPAQPSIPSMTVIATVNTVEFLDPALLRPGRFDEVVECKEPTETVRMRILQHYLRKTGMLESVASVGLDTLNAAMDKFAPADIAKVVDCLHAGGIEEWEHEVNRVKVQRGLYAGDACFRFMNRTRSPGPPR